MNTKRFWFLKARREYRTAGSDPTSIVKIEIDAKFIGIEMVGVCDTIIVQWNWRGGRWSKKHYITGSKIMDGIFFRLMDWFEGPQEEEDFDPDRGIYGEA
jgi:hypothetical protein